MTNEEKLDLIRQKYLTNTDVDWLIYRIEVLTVALEAAKRLLFKSSKGIVQILHKLD